MLTDWPAASGSSATDLEAANTRKRLHAPSNAVHLQEARQCQLLLCGALLPSVHTWLSAEQTAGIAVFWEQINAKCNAT